MSTASGISTGNVPVFKQPGARLQLAVEPKVELSTKTERSAPSIAA